MTDQNKTNSKIGTEIWQYKNVLSDEWATDERAMNNPKFKSFADYEKHTKSLNKKFKLLPPIECRILKPNTNQQTNVCNTYHQVNSNTPSTIRNLKQIMNGI